MRRRTCVASLATLAATAGCLGGTSDADGSPSPRAPKTVSVFDVGSEGTPDGIELNVTADDDRITERSTARVSLEYTNTAGETRILNIDPDAPDPVSSVDDSPGLVLLSDAYDPERTSSGCWKPVRDRFVQPAVAHRYEIAPGDTATLGYDVWAAPTQDGCIRSGTYRLDPVYGSATLAVDDR